MVASLDEDANKVWLTTIDNPFNPHEQWDEWYAYDTSRGYNTCGLLARLIDVNPKMTSNKYDSEIERAINKVLESLDPFGIYLKI